MEYLRNTRVRPRGANHVLDNLYIFDIFLLLSLPPVTDNCPSLISGRRMESMWPDRVSNTGSLILESDALPAALYGPSSYLVHDIFVAVPWTWDI